jgi:hypothetical protein
MPACLQVDVLAAHELPKKGGFLSTVDPQVSEKTAAQPEVQGTIKGRFTPLLSQAPVGSFHVNLTPAAEQHDPVSPQTHAGVLTQASQTQASHRHIICMACIQDMRSGSIRIGQYDIS